MAGAALMTLLDPPLDALQLGGAGSPGGGSRSTGATPGSSGPGSPLGSPVAGAAGSSSSAPGSPLGSVRSAGAGLHYVAEAEGSGWSSVVRLACGFLPLAPAGGGAQQAQHAQQGAARFGVALWNALPVDLPLAGAELALRDEQGAFSVPLVDADGSSSTGSSNGAGHVSRSSGGAWEPLPAGAAGLARLAAPAPLSPPGLAPGGWRRLAAAVPLRCAGALTAAWVRLRFGASSSVALRLSAGAGAELLPGAALRAATLDTVLPPFPTASG